MISTTIKLTDNISEQTVRRITDLNANPRPRATAGRLINNATRTVIGYAQEIADRELKNDRPEERRRNPGIAHYRDSFEVLPNHMDNIGRMVGGFRNTHPNALRIEYGTKPHDIPQSGETFLAFPFQPGATRSGRTKPPGNWPVEFGEGLAWSGDEALSTDFVGEGHIHHPGTPAFHILRRAKAKYRRQAGH